MNPPSVLLDHSFLAAAADAGNEDHDEAVAIYRSLVEDFVAQRYLLVARADHLAAVANPDLFAALDKLHVARQHRNAAEELMRGMPIDIDVAITLVLIHRCKVRKVATFDERLARFDLDIVASSGRTIAADDLSSRTAPQRARRSTA
jgi:predicted nucleic acid-binding protein